jgi:hypothetical protein
VANLLMVFILGVCEVARATSEDISSDEDGAVGLSVVNQATRMDFSSCSLTANKSMQELTLLRCTQH